MNKDVRSYMVIFIIVLVIHLIAFIKIIPAQKSIGVNQTKLMMGYVSFYSATKTNQIQQSIRKSKPKHTAALHQQKPNISTEYNKQSIISKTKVTHQQSTGEKQELLMELHDAIAKQQIYPDDALILGERGTVTLGFSLSPTGEVSQTKIMKSSGFTRIDQAALDAVRRISPFILAKRYLHVTTYFMIDVSFEN